MMDFKYTPSSWGKKEKAYAALYAALAVVPFVFSFFPIPGTGILQLIFVVFVALDMMHCIKYCLSSYTYTITEEYGDAMLVVTQTLGRRISTLANFKLSDIRRVEKMPASDISGYIQSKYGSSCVKYDYLVGMDRRDAIVITVRNDHTHYVVSLAYNDEFMEMLLYAQANSEEFERE